MKEWILKEMKKWQKVLHLEDMTLTVEYEKINAIMQAECRYPYKEIILKYHDAMVQEIKTNKQQAQRTVLHEMLHAVTDPLYSKGYSRFISENEIENEREAVTDKLTNIIYTLYTTKH